MGCLGTIVRIVAISFGVSLVMALIAQRYQKATGPTPEQIAATQAAEEAAMRSRLAQIQPLVRIDDIARKTPTQVQKVLGAASKRQLFMLPDGRKSVWNHYRSDSVLVLYVQGKANMLLLFPTDIDIRDPNEILALLGLAPVADARWPDAERNRMLWENVHGLAEIAYERVGLLRGVQEIRVLVKE